MAVAVFNYAKWAARFPELANGGVTETVALSFFEDAGFFLDNSDCSPVQDMDKRLTLLNYVVAHLAALAGYPLAPGSTTPTAPGTVGRISRATEGTVSVESDYGTVRESEAWWIQTQYGATFWQMTRWLRTMRYVAAPPRYFGPAAFLGRNGGYR